MYKTQSFSHQNLQTSTKHPLHWIGIAVILASAHLSSDKHFELHSINITLYKYAYKFHGLVKWSFNFRLPKMQSNYTNGWSICFIFWSSCLLKWNKWNKWKLANAHRIDKCMRNIRNTIRSNKNCCWAKAMPFLFLLISFVQNKILLRFA